MHILWNALKPYILIALSLLAMTMGLSALPLYFAIILVIYPVALCAWVTRWEEAHLLRRGITTVETTINMRGIVFNEPLSHLSEVYFFSPTVMANKLTNLALLKLLCGMGLLALSGIQAARLGIIPPQTRDQMGSLAMGIAIFCLIGRQVMQDSALYHQCRYRHYQELCHRQEGITLYSAETLRKKGLTQYHTPMLEALLK